RPRCGDQTVDAGEQCDNDFVALGMTPMAGDGCDSSCNLETICGDGMRDSSGEGCDNGSHCSNNKSQSCTSDGQCGGGTCGPQNGDGCSSLCRYEFCGNSGPATASNPFPA